MICENCGKEIEKDLLFCIHCGCEQTLSEPEETPKEPEPVAIQESQPTPVKKKRRLWPLFVCIAALAVLCAAVIASVFLRPQTVTLLVSREIRKTNTQGLTIQGEEYTYDDAGRLTSFTLWTRYGSGPDMVNEQVFTYQYNSDGQLKSTVCHMDGRKRLSVGYRYDDGVLDDVQVESADALYQVRVNSEGRIRSITGGNVEYRYKFHDNGAPSEVEVYYGDRKFSHTQWDKAGRTLECFQYDINKDKRIHSGTVYTYDEKGNLTGVVDYARDMVQTRALEIDYQYDGDRVTGAVVTVDKEKYNGTITFTVEQQGNIRKATVTDLDISGNATMTDLDMLRSIIIEYERNDKNELIWYKVTYQGIRYLEVLQEFKQVEMPYDYQVPFIGDPKFFTLKDD